jgi:hypothetical protein
VREIRRLYLIASLVGPEGRRMERWGGSKSFELKSEFKVF